MDDLHARLKALRESAIPTLTVRAMADRLGMAHPTYHRYESAKGFKGRFLPMDLARRIAAVLVDHGVNPDDVLALAGIGSNEVGAIDLSMGEEQLLDTFRELGAEQRALLLQLANQMRASRPSDTPPTRPASATVHSGTRKFRHETEEPVRS